jgi:hypothetical protein
MNVNSKASCRGLLKYLNILPFYSQYILSLLLLVMKNVHLFVLNTEIHVINTWQSINLHVPSIKLAKCKNGVYYMDIIIFNHLPRNLRELLNDFKKFKSAINNFLLNHSFYSINEYLEWSEEMKWNPCKAYFLMITYECVTYLLYYHLVYNVLYYYYYY